MLFRFWSFWELTFNLKKIFISKTTEALTKIGTWGTKKNTNEALTALILFMKKILTLGAKFMYTKIIKYYMAMNVRIIKKIKNFINKHVYHTLQIFCQKLQDGYGMKFNSSLILLLYLC